MKKVFIILILSFVAWKGHSDDNHDKNNFNSLKMLKIDNPWLNTGNISGLVFNDNDLIMFDAGMSVRDANFHRMREPGEITKYTFSTSSYLKVSENLFTSGGFHYNNYDESGSRWNGTFDPYSGNPYILADSLTGVSTHKESYQLTGQLAYKLSDRIILGTGIEYFVAVAAKQKDPRPENIVTYFQFHPSVLFDKNDSKIGFDLAFSNRKEEIKYETKRSSFYPVFFMFKGFGFYSDEIDRSYNRFMFSKNVLGGVQYEKEIFNMQSLSELRFDLSFQTVDDGSTFISKKDGGDWNTYEITLSQLFEKRDGENYQVFSGNFSIFNGDGKEYTQNKNDDVDYLEFITQAISLKMNRVNLFGELGYDYFKMIEHDQVDYEAKASIGILSNNEKYYFIPEIFNSSYLNILGNLSFQKNFYFGRYHFAPTITAEYKYNLDNSNFLFNNEPLTDKHLPDIYTYDFEYYTSDLLKFQACVNIGYRPIDFKGIKQIDLYLMADYWKPTGLDTKQMNYCAKLGFVF